MKYLIFFALLLTLSACNLEPRLEPPCMEMPCRWRVESDEETTAANIRWWEILDDPALNELILLSLHNNRDLAVAVYRVCEFIAQYQIVRSQLFPQVNLEATAIKERVPPALSPTSTAMITPFYTYEFTLSYEFDFWGKIRSQAHAAYTEALEAVENRRTVVLTLVSAVAEAYMQLRELDRELEIALATLEERREYLKIATLRFEGGLTSEIEVTQAAAAFQETLADVTLLEELIPQQENLISVLIGTSSTSIIRGRPINEFCYPPEVPAGLPSELLERRPDILAAELRLIAANAEIGAARAAFFPDISLTGLFGGASFQLKTLFNAASRAWQYGLDIMQPIYTGGELTGELNVTIAQKQEALYAYEQTILNAFKEVNDALIAYGMSKELVKVQERNAAANKEYLRLSWLRYYNGQADYLTVLDAETRLFAAQIDLTQAQGDVAIAFVELYKALGGGWVIDADCSLRKN